MSSIYQTHQPAGGSDGLFLSLKDGESVKVRIFSEPAMSQQEFKNEDTGEVTISTKYSWVVYNRNENKAQIFSRGASIFKQLADLVEEWGEPDEYDIVIKRKGAMLATRWTITPVKKSEDLTLEQTEECKKIDLLKVIKGWWLKDLDNQMSNKLKPKTDDVVADYDPSQEPEINLEGIPF